MRIQLPSGGHATVSKDVKPEALDEMVSAAAKTIEPPDGRHYTRLSYKCRINRHKDCAAKLCQCPCGHPSD